MSQLALRKFDPASLNGDRRGEVPTGVDALPNASRVGVDPPGELKRPRGQGLSRSWIEEQRMIIGVLDFSREGADIPLKGDPDTVVDERFVEGAALRAPELGGGACPCRVAGRS